MRRPLPSVASPTSSCSRGGTPSSPLRFHADDVAGHPPTIIINTFRLSLPAREVRGLSLPRDDRGVHGEAGQCQLHLTACGHSPLQPASTLTVHFDRVETDRYVAIIRCSDLGRPPSATSTLKFATASLSRVKLSAFK